MVEQERLYSIGEVSKICDVSNGCCAIMRKLG